MSKGTIYDDPREIPEGAGPFSDVFAAIHRVITDPNAHVTTKQVIELAVSVSLTVCANLRLQYGDDPNCPTLQGFALIISKELMLGSEQHADDVEAKIAARATAMLQ